MPKCASLMVTTEYGVVVCVCVCVCMCIVNVVCVYVDA